MEILSSVALVLTSDFLLVHELSQFVCVNSATLDALVKDGSVWTRRTSSFHREAINLAFDVRTWPKGSNTRVCIPSFLREVALRLLPKSVWVAGGRPPNQVTLPAEASCPPIDVADRPIIAGSFALHAFLQSKGERPTW